MLTMIIADDENIARKSLELFIKKEFPDIEVVASATDGMELVKLVEKEQPDIAIVDINMPGFTGIEAIEILHNKGVRTRFIIHTAYGEFDYVKKALDMKVDGYLLKPEKQEESIRTIRKLCDDIRKTANENEEKSNIRNLLHEVSPVLESEILLSLATDKAEIEEFEMLCQVNGIKFHSGCIVTLIHYGNKLLNKKDIRTAVRQTLDTLCDYLVSITESSIIIFLFLPGHIIKEEKDSWISDVTKLLLYNIEEKMNTDFGMGVGAVYDSFSEMGKSYEESLRMLKSIKNKEITEYSAGTGQEEKRSIYVERAVSYINKSFAMDLSLNIVAEHIKLSSFYLSRLIKQELGVSFIEYLTKVRMEEAKRLSLETSLTIKEIAERCGYSNDTYFCKVFKRYTNKTIGEFRREL